MEIIPNAKVTVNENGNKIEDQLLTYSEEEQLQNKINSEHAKLPQRLKYLVVPQEVFDAGLSGNDAIVYAFINSWVTEKGQRFYFTNEDMGLKFNIHYKTITEILKRLKEKNLIEIHQKTRPGGGQIRFIVLKGQPFRVRESRRQHPRKTDFKNSVKPSGSIYEYSMNDQNRGKRNKKTKLIDVKDEKGNVVAVQKVPDNDSL